MEDIKYKIEEIFNECQEIGFEVDKNKQKLSKLIRINSEDNNLNKEKFTEAIFDYLRECLQKILILSDETCEVFTLIDFFAELLIELSKNKTEVFIQNQLIHFLLQNLQANSDHVRLNICRTLNKYLELMNGISSKELDNQIFNRMQISILDRTRDTNMNVQIEALNVASWLQVPSDQYCPVINAFVCLLKIESHTDIRLKILDLIAINKTSFEFFRKFLIYDTNREIRDKTLSIIEKKIPNKNIDALLRREICGVLFRDRNQLLLEKFIDKWLKNKQKNTNRDCYELIKSLNIKNLWYTDVDEYKLVNLTDKRLLFIIRTAFKSADINIKLLLKELENLLSNLDLLFSDIDQAFYFRSLIIEIQKIDSKSLSISKFENFYQKLVKLISDNNYDDNLFLIFNLIDALFRLSSTTTSNSLNLINTLLSVVNYSKNNYIIFELLFVYLDQLPAEFLWVYIKNKLQVNDVNLIKKYLCVLCVLLSKMDAQDFSNADCFNLSCADDSFFEINDAENIDLDLDHNFIDLIMQKFILKHIAHVEPEVRALSMRALGLLSLINKDVFEKYSKIFKHMIDYDFPEPTLEAVKAIFNICQVYNILSDENQPEWNDILESVIKFLYCSNQKLQFKTYEGFAKLLLNNSISKKLKKAALSNMLVGYLSENTTKNVLLKSCLCAFFTEYIKLDEKNIYSMIDIFAPTVNLQMKKNTLKFKYKDIAKFYYFLIGNTNIKTLNIHMIGLALKSIFENITDDSGDLKYISNWLEILLEFNINESQIENNSALIDKLNIIIDRLSQLISIFRTRKWPFKRNIDLKELIKYFKGLLCKHNSHVASKRKLIDEDSSDEKDDSISSPKSSRLI